MPAKKHNFTIVEIKAGVMVIVSGLVFLAFSAAVIGFWPEPKQRIYVCYFSDTLGLAKGNDVRFGGVKIGTVHAIGPDTKHVPSGQEQKPEKADTPDKPGKIVQAPIIRVEASVSPDVPVNEKSVAFIGQTTLTADKHLEITTGLPQTRLLAEGEEIPAGLSGGLFDQAGEIASSVESGIEAVKALLGVDQALLNSKDGKLDTTLVTLLRGVDQTVRESKGLVGDARNIMGQYRGDIGTVINEVVKIEQSANSLVTELNGLVSESRPDIQSSIQQFPVLLGRVDALADDLEAIATSLQRTLETTQDTIQTNRPAIEETISDLRETVGNLKNFSRNLAEQPESVLWGKSTKERKGQQQK